jgi:hypothetical protein
MGRRSNDLPDWFKARDYRVAKVGEEEFYEFYALLGWVIMIIVVLQHIRNRVEKKLMKNNTKTCKIKINGEWAVGD